MLSLVLCCVTLCYVTVLVLGLGYHTNHDCCCRRRNRTCTRRSLALALFVRLPYHTMGVLPSTQPHVATVGSRFILPYHTMVIATVDTTARGMCLALAIYHTCRTPFFLSLSSQCATICFNPLLAVHMGREHCGPSSSPEVEAMYGHPLCQESEAPTAPSLCTSLCEETVKPLNSVVYVKERSAP